MAGAGWCVVRDGSGASGLVPLSFVLTAGPAAAAAEQSELAAFREAAVAAAARGETIWIVKPGHGNRGHGIQVLSSAKAVEAHLRSQKPPDVAHERLVVEVQQQMRRSLLGLLDASFGELVGGEPGLDLNRTVLLCGG